MKNKVRFLKFLLIIFVTFSCGLSSCSKDNESIKHLIYEIENGEVVITGYNAADADVIDLVIPKYIKKEHNEYPVTGISPFAFYECDSLKSIEIPSSVTSIGFSAFKDCNSLEKITIPFVGAKLNGTKNTNFGYIFGADVSGKNLSFVPTSLKKVTITGGNNIDDYAFFKCDLLESIEISNSVTSIGEYAFCNCSSLENIEIPNSVTKIGKHSFISCISLKSIEIPNSVTVIDYDTFGYCTSLENIEIPNSVTKIGEAAFYKCSSLENIEIPNSVTRIENNAFRDCNSLTSIVIPNSVTKIEFFAFFGCSSLTIYCEAINQPSGWNDMWNHSECPVYWKNQWHYDDNGNPVPM